LLVLAGLVAGAAALPAPAGAIDLSGAVERALEKRNGPRSERPPSRDEIARDWDAFLTAVVKRAGSDAPPGALRAELLAVLIDERYRLVQMLTDLTIEGPELVDSLFVTSWEQLAPLLDQVAAQLPPEAQRRYRSFLEAGDLMRAAERLGVAREVAGSPDSLRRLARILLGDETGDPLRFDTGVDPEMRRIFGFGPPLEPPAPSPLVKPVEQNPGAGLGLPLQRLGAALGDWLFPTAWAAAAPSDRATLVARLNTWVPGGRTELRQYVPLVHDLLRLTATDTEARSDERLDTGTFEVFEHLVLATAWQESCWRQFVRREGEVQPLLSPAGAIGLMQINARVWRGIYDPEGLEADIGYNGRAGAEILSHYLRDHALRAGEQRNPGGADNLARATYAAYNGGPRHLSRYRRKTTSPHLRTIDRDFWRRYQAVKRGDEREMLSCYPTAAAR
jgi:hypothetical protein